MHKVVNKILQGINCSYTNCYMG